VLSKATQQTIAFIFGVAIVATILVIAFIVPNPTPFQYAVFRIVLALASAGVAAMIPGFLTVEVGNAVRATGAIAVFVIVFFFSPAILDNVPTAPPGGGTTTPDGDGDGDGDGDPPEPVLTNISIAFHTTRDNKNDSTHLSLWVKSGSTEIASLLDFAGGIPFPDPGDSPPFPLNILVPKFPKSRVENGLTAKLGMVTENGDDDNWWFQFKLVCTFSDGSQLTMTHGIEERFDDDERVEALFPLTPDA